MSTGARLRFTTSCGVAVGQPYGGPFAGCLRLLLRVLPQQKVVLPWWTREDNLDQYSKRVLHCSTMVSCSAIQESLARIGKQDTHQTPSQLPPRRRRRARRGGTPTGPGASWPSARAPRASPWGRQLREPRGDPRGWGADPAVRGWYAALGGRVAGAVRRAGGVGRSVDGRSC